jgi:hypothetical protein
LKLVMVGQVYWHLVSRLLYQHQSPLNRTRRKESEK